MQKRGGNHRVSKGKFFTLIMVFLSISIVFGGWFLIRELLKKEEKELLRRSGQISMQSSEFVLQKEEDKEQIQEKNEIEFEQMTTLSDDDIVFILNAWEEGGYTVLHEPQQGQMSMKQAITAGLDWITSLSEQGVLPSFVEEGYEFNETSASLSTLDMKTDSEKSLLSFWEICYIRDDIRIVLTIHAESGQIFSADISIENGKMPYDSISETMYRICMDKVLMKILFPFLKEEKENSLIVGTYNMILEEIKKEMIFGWAQWDIFTVDEGEPIVEISMGLCTKNSDRYQFIVEKSDSIVDSPVVFYDSAAVGEESVVRDDNLKVEEKKKKIKEQSEATMTK